MNKNITEEELLLRKRARRRLVGAIVLVVAAIVILPLIFDEPKPDTETHEIDIHLFPQDDISEIPPLVLPSENFSSENLEQTEQNNGRSELSSDLTPDFSETLEPNDQLSADDAHDERKQTGRIPIPGIKPRLVPVQTERSVQSGQTSGQFVVQLGAFSDQSKAQQQLHNLKTNGLNAFTETHTVNGKVVTRVRIGPFSSRDTAENELKKLRRQGLDGVVTPR
ncbi:DedD protein [Nitrosomonas sp. Nm51]|uniref:SPOR domain-containing protein n=1 Tax=Nitrosomonas sp. Nm51 TaxID=133720 RepID=UPI0008AB0764|nr:SPOR domain-containing protein [Nitrosomonas sp. Nm51]SEQ77306.1 DedD protein [Nitrosomonas sp. Nm51]